jgi:glutathione S-transferase
MHLGQCYSHSSRLNGSRAQSTLWLLEELQIPYELEIHHRQKNMLAPPSLKKLHPLGKSPLVSITPPDASEPIILAESAFITQYMCDHFPKGKALVPTRWKDGQEGKVGGETEEWMRYEYLMNYIEGSFMFTMVLNFILTGTQAPTNATMYCALTNCWQA